MGTVRSWLSDPFKLIWLAIPIFALHVAEEALGGFVDWLNSLVDRPLAFQMFLTSSAVCMVITSAAVAGAALSKSRAGLSACLGWFAFLMLSNGTFHVIATLWHGRYSPGTVTALLLYIPYFSLLLNAAIRRGAFSLWPFLMVAGAIGTPGTIHFYRVVFEGRRLF